MHELHNDIFFNAFIEKKDPKKQFSTTAISMYSICLIIYKRFKKKKSVQSLVCAGRWEDPGRKIKT